jgi:MOSC domain-containing protein YiiM
MTSLARVIAVCTSQKKHEKKINTGSGILRVNYGVIGDVHADYSTHRQISLLAIESIDKMRKLGLNVHPGDFAENITTEGIDLTSLQLGTQLYLGEKALLQVTQIGKVCHNPCAIGRQAGDCIMPREGIFARVLNGGEVKIGNEIKIV